MGSGARHRIRRHRLPSGAIRAGIAQEGAQRLWKSENPNFAEAGSGRQRRCAGLEGGQEPTNCDRPARQWAGIPASDDRRPDGHRRRRQRQPGDQRTERTMAGAGGHRRRQVAWADDGLTGGLTARPGLIHIIVGRIDLDHRQPAGRADQQRSRLVGTDCARDRRHPAPGDDLQQKRSHPGHKAEPSPPPHCPPSGRHCSPSPLPPTGYARRGAQDTAACAAGRAANVPTAVARSNRGSKEQVRPAGGRRAPAGTAGCGATPRLRHRRAQRGEPPPARPPPPARATAPAAEGGRPAQGPRADCE